MTDIKHNLEGLVFGRYKVIKRLPPPSRSNHDRVWLAECVECRTLRTFNYRALQKVALSVKECTCYRANGKLAPMESHLLHIHNNMKQRCYNPNDTGYYNYGGRGITVCDEWRNGFKSFYLWALDNNWKKGLEIDRVDNNGPYCPENCRIVTRQQNASNTRNNVFVTINDEKLTIAEASRRYNPFVSINTIRGRITSGWKSEAAVLLPKVNNIPKKIKMKIQDEIMNVNR